MEWNSLTRITAVEGIVAGEIAGGSALLNLETSRYYKLNDTAALLWEELERSVDRTCTLGHLCGVIEDHYDIDSSTCLGDLTKVCSALFEAHLIKVRFNAS